MAKRISTTRTNNTVSSEFDSPIKTLDHLPFPYKFVDTRG